MTTEEQRNLRNARVEVERHAARAKELTALAASIGDDVHANAALVVKRTSVRWLGPIVAIAVFVGVMFSLILYVQASSRCTTPDGLICRVVAPQNEASAAVVNNLIAGTLEGVEYIGNGGTAEAFLAGDTTPNSASVLAPNGDGTWTIVHAIGDDSYGRPASYRIGKLAADAFPDVAAQRLRDRAQAVYETGIPKIFRSQLEGGEPFTTRIYRIPGAVVFETAFYSK